MQAYTKTIFLLWFLCLSTFGIGQEFKGGFFFGLSTSQIHGDNLSGYFKTGLNTGFFTTREIGENSNLLLELAFVQKGAKEPGSDTSNYYKASLNYIEIPLLYQFRWKQLSFDLGPALDILVGAKEEWDGIERETSPPYHSFNLAFIVGVNWHFAESWHVAFRTNNSLIPIRDGNANPADNPALRQRGKYGQRNVSLTFAIVYHLGED